MLDVLVTNLRDRTIIIADPIHPCDYGILPCKTTASEAAFPLLEIYAEGPGIPLERQLGEWKQVEISSGGTRLFHVDLRDVLQSAGIYLVVVTINQPQIDPDAIVHIRSNVLVIEVKENGFILNRSVKDSP